MNNPTIGEITLFAGNTTPKGWAKCDGTELRIGEYSPLFTVLGTKYGGDGHTTFHLPNLPPVDEVASREKNDNVAKGDEGYNSGIYYYIALEGMYPPH